MITTTEMYWLTRCDPVKEFLVSIDHCSAGLIGVCVAAAMLLTGVALFTGNGQYEMFSKMDDATFNKLKGTMRKWAMRLGVVSVALWLVGATASVAAALMPTTREMAAIVMVPAIANNEKVQTVGNKLYDLAAEWLDELRPKKEAK